MKAYKLAVFRNGDYESLNGRMNLKYRIGERAESHFPLIGFDTLESAIYFYHLEWAIVEAVIFEVECDGLKPLPKLAYQITKQDFEWFWNNVTTNDELLVVPAPEGTVCFDWCIPLAIVYPVEEKV